MGGYRLGRGLLTKHTVWGGYSSSPSHHWMVHPLPYAASPLAPAAPGTVGLHDSSPLHTSKTSIAHFMSRGPSSQTRSSNPTTAHILWKISLEGRPVSVMMILCRAFLLSVGGAPRQALEQLLQLHVIREDPRLGDELIPATATHTRNTHVSPPRKQQSHCSSNDQRTSR
jgi:hypothetical protein